MPKPLSVIISFLFVFTSSLYSQNNAIQLDGANDYIEVADNNAIDLSNSFTLETWIYPTGAGSDGTQGGIIFNKENSYELARFADGTLQYALSANGAGTDWTWTNTTVVAPLNQWSHIALVKNNTSLTLYLNGRSAFTAGGQPGTLSANTQTLRIGGRPSFSQHFNGYIDETRIWNTARTQSEIKTYAFNRNLSLSTTGLVAYYRMNEGSGTSAANAGTNFTGLNGTLNNGPLWIASPIQFATNAIALDGINDKIQTQLDLSNMSAFTLEGWVYSNGLFTTSLFGQNDVIEWGFTNATTLTCWTANGGSIGWTFNSTTFPLNTWNHVAYVGNGTTLSLYVNGVLRTSGGNATGNYGSSGYRFTIGADVWNPAGEYFSGSMDEVRVWNTARTATEIANNMNKEISPSTAGLLATYRMNQGIAAGNNTGLVTVWDMTGNNNGTLVNSTLTNGNSTSNYIVQNSLITLPLRWVSFTAKAAGQTARLEWTTTEELNTKDFVVQHSTDNINWSNIATIKANNTAGTNTYSYTDNAPANGVNYYRILQTDIDGRSSYSDIRIVKSETAASYFTILNNPATNKAIRLQLVEAAPVSVFNNDGKLLIQRKLGAGITELNMSSYANGIYLIKVNNQSARVLLQ